MFELTVLFMSSMPNGTSLATYVNPSSQQTQSGNPLDSDKETQGQDPLTVEQVAYLGFLEQRAMNAQEKRDRIWPEFSQKTYLQFFQQNEDIANTRLPSAKKNEDETLISSGTVESKLGSLLSNINSLNITSEILAFDKDDAPLKDLGVAITDILDRCAENDGGIDGGDEEKRMLRQKELLKQGTVFVQDRWVKKSFTRKKLKKAYDGKFNGVDWDKKLECVFEGPERTLLYGPNVYLGDITQFAMDDQPYIFTVETISLDMARSVYGEFENFQYVKGGMPPASPINASAGIGGRTIYDGKFRMFTVRDDQVEVIKYQDQTRDEFQIMINGVMMLPIGFPLSAVTPGGKYNIAKQILYVINPQFAYGKSFVSSGDVYELSKVIDDMLSLFILKTRQSITPAWANMSGRVISKRSLSPGNITQGIPSGALQPIGNQGQGVTTGEYQIYKELLDRVENSTVSPIFQGQEGNANQTATEVLQMQEQAKKSLGITIAACTLLEVKLAYLRLPILLENYFKPTGETQSNGDYQKTYRTVSTDVSIENDGQGVRQIVPIDGELPEEDAVRQMELQYEKKTGTPLQLIFMSPAKLQQTRVTWRAVANPKQKESSTYDKVLFNEMLNGILSLTKIGSRPNITGIEDEFAETFSKDRNKLFANASSQPITSQDPTGSESPIIPDNSGVGANTPGMPTASPGMKAAAGVM